MLTKRSSSSDLCLWQQAATSLSEAPDSPARLYHFLGCFSHSDSPPRGCASLSLPQRPPLLPGHHHHSLVVRRISSRCSAPPRPASPRHRPMCSPSASVTPRRRRKKAVRRACSSSPPCSNSFIVVNGLVDSDHSVWFGLICLFRSMECAPDWQLRQRSGRVAEVGTWEEMVQVPIDERCSQSSRRGPLSSGTPAGVAISAMELGVECSIGMYAEEH